MTFFNKKEDVIYIELTPHGRKLLSEGKLMPYGYSFFDDDILYNAEKAGSTEDNSITKTRILVDTPSLKPQTSYRGVESEINNSLTIEKNNLLLSPIGSNKPSSKGVNSWEVSMIRGEISASSGCMTSSSPIIHVPQIECEINYKLSVGNTERDGYSESEDIIFSDIYSDNSYLIVKESQIMIHLSEKHGFSYTDSLNMEVYLYSQDENDLQKMKFISEPDRIENDLYVGPRPIPALGSQHPDLVENYIDIFVDNQIEDYEICRGSKVIIDNDLYLSREIECEDLKDRNVDVYLTDVDTLEDCEQ
jgi:hypothetical protein